MPRKRSRRRAGWRAFAALVCRGEQACGSARGQALWAAFEADTLPRLLADREARAATPPVISDTAPPEATAPAFKGSAPVPSTTVEAPPQRVCVVPGLDGWDVRAGEAPPRPFASKREAISAGRVAARALAPSVLYVAGPGGALAPVQAYAAPSAGRT